MQGNSTLSFSAPVAYSGTVKKDDQITARLYTLTRAKLKRLARTHGRSEAWVINHLIEKEPEAGDIALHETPPPWPAPPTRKK